MPTPTKHGDMAIAQPQIPLAMARPAKSPGLTRHFIDRLIGALLNWKWLFLIGCIGSAGMTYYASSLLAKKVWESETTLVYAPLPVPDDGKGLYSPPDLKTLSTLVNSPENIEKLRSEFKIELPAKAVDKNLTVVIPNGTKVIKLTFRWDDGPITAAMLNRLTEIFVETVAALRRDKLAEHVRDYEINLKNTADRLTAAAKAVRDFNRRHSLVDYHEDLLLINKQIMEYEASIAQHKRTESDTLAQMKRMTEHLEDVKKQEEKEAEKDKQYQAANESVADSRRRQDRLRELIGDQQRKDEVNALIVNKQKEYDKAKALLVKGAIPRAEVELHKSELDALKARIQESPQILKWKAELEKIDKDIVPDGAKKSTGSPIIQQVLFRRLELELQLTATREEVAQIERGVTEKRKKLEVLDGLRGEYDTLVRKVESINVERLQVETQIASMKNLMGLSAAEFVVSSKAEVGEYPASSNKKILIAGFGGLGMFLSFGLVVLLEMSFAGWSPEGRAHQLGLLQLARVAPFGRKARFQQLRGLALRLRQIVPDAGTAIVFSSLSNTGDGDAMLSELAGFFALRDERVLILDARVRQQPQGQLSLEGPSKSAEISKKKKKKKKAEPVVESPTDSNDEASQIPPPPPGLSDYLTFVCNNPDDICQPEEGYGVDRITPGNTVVTADTLATHRMAELMIELRRRYTILLVIGPSLSHAVDLQILATMSHGVVAVVDAPVPIRREVRRTISDLGELGSPVLGQIVLGVVD